MGLFGGPKKGYFGPGNPGFPGAGNPCPDFGCFSGCRGPFNKCIFRSGFGVVFVRGAVREFVRARVCAGVCAGVRGCARVRARVCAGVGANIQVSYS